MPGDDAPVGLERSRHLDLEGRHRHVWQRRLALLVLTAIPVLALLDVFGQASDPTSAQAAAATLTVDSPARVRGGLVITARVTVVPRSSLHDMRLVFDHGWFDAMTFNGVAPQPSQESSRNDAVVYDYGPQPAGRLFRAWLSLQVNPTNFGSHPQTVTLYDGSRPIVALHRDLTVFP